MTTTRQRLRAEVFALADDRCEHPVKDGRCPNRAVEMAHIVPRGMGHTGYRDVIENVMAACTIHARSTDDLSSDEWLHLGPSGVLTPRTLLAQYVRLRRMMAGWDV